MRNVLRCLALLVVINAAACAAHAPDTDPAVFIVRHAEKAGGVDPALTVAGTARANALADRLHGAGITRIFTTDTLRTRSTAEPLARRLGLEPEIYDHRKASELVAGIRNAGETVLVVGHSNTIGEMAAAFGVNPGPAVADDEFDRLYVITLSGADSRVDIQRYGKTERVAEQ